MRNRMRSTVLGACVAVAGFMTLTGVAGAAEVTYDPAAPQGAFGGLVTSNYIAFIALAVALVGVGVPILLARAGITGVWNTLRGAASTAKKGRGK